MCQACSASMPPTGSFGHGEAHNPAPLSVYEAAFERIRASSDTTLYVAEREGQVVGTSC